MPKNTWKIKKKGDIFKKNCKYSILYALHAMFENLKIEFLRKNKKQCKKFHIFCKFCAKILEILKILLQNYCYQSFLQVSSKVTVFKNYLSNSNFMKKLLKYYL